MAVFHLAVLENGSKGLTCDKKTKKVYLPVIIISDIVIQFLHSMQVYRVPLIAYGLSSRHQF